MVIAFWTLFGLVLWCLIGYPLVMLAKARVFPKPTQVAPSTPSVSVVIAVRNEEGRIRGRIENILKQEYPRDLLQVIVAANGCTDGTEGVVEAFAQRDPRVSLVVSPPEEGKAGSLNRGVAFATGEVIVFGDARQKFASDVIERLTAWLADPSVGAVSGRLVIGDSADAAVEGVRRYWQFEVALRQAESTTGSVVGVTGAVYAMRREAYEPLPPGVILDDLLTPMRVVFAGKRVVFAHDAVAYDEASPDSSVEFRRKVRTTVGNLHIIRTEPRLLSPLSNPIFGRYVSHKLLRVLLPVCLVGMAVTGALAGGPLYLSIVGAQLAVYVLGGLGLLLPIPGLGVPAAFVLAHGVVASAFAQSWRGHESLWGRPAKPQSG